MTVKIGINHSVSNACSIRSMSASGFQLSQPRFNLANAMHLNSLISVTVELLLVLMFSLAMHAVVSPASICLHFFVRASIGRDEGTRVYETGDGWDKFWLGQCPSVLNESPDCDTNDVFGEHLTTAFTGATRIIDERFASEISPKKRLAPEGLIVTHVAG